MPFEINRPTQLQQLHAALGDNASLDNICKWYDRPWAAKQLGTTYGEWLQHVERVLKKTGGTFR